MTLGVKTPRRPVGGGIVSNADYLGSGRSTTMALRGGAGAGDWGSERAILERCFRSWLEQSTYGRAVPVGSSPLVVVVGPRRAGPAAPSNRTNPTDVHTADPTTLAEPIVRLMSALSLNKSQAARVLRVTRPTLYEWLDGKAPNAGNGARIETLARWLARAGISAARPLPLRLVRQPVVEGKPALIEALEAEVLDEGLVGELLARARELADEAETRSAEREARLRERGFEEPSQEERRDQLARNIAMLDWPER